MTNTFQQTRWSLGDLFSGHDTPDMQEALKRLDTDVAEFENRRASLVPHIAAPDFLALIQAYEAINHLAQRVYGYAGLNFAADTQDQAAQAFLSQVQQIMAGLKNRTLFFELWWKELDDDNARRLLDTAGDYCYWLEAMRYFKPHTLTEAEEKIINIKDTTGAQAIQNLYDAVTNRYTFTLTVEGEEKSLTRGEIMVYVRQPDPDLRARAYQELYRVYGQDGPILGQMYQALVRDWRNEQVDLRHFSSPIAARNLINDIPDAVVDTLLEVAKKNATIFQRFLRLKARLIGMDRLRRYDLYAPVAIAEKTYSFTQGVELVQESLARFDPRLADLALQVLRKNHLDSEVRKGKQNGAFCAPITPDLTPWVLLSYQGRPDDVFTLAHELGHAIHGMLASHHSLFTYQSSLPLAETASTFGEMVLLDHLLLVESDDQLRRTLLFEQIDGAYATIGRQAFFALFERRAHEMIQKGATVDELCDAYMENLQEQFGDALEVSDEFRWEWVSVPHFYHVPFYVYAYSFGQLLVFALYKQYKTEGDAFKPRLLQILSAGGSEAPAKVLSAAGIDILSAEFWQGGFDVIDRLVAQLEALPS